MKSLLKNNIQLATVTDGFFWGSAALMLCCCIGFALTEEWFLLALPFALGFFVLVLTDLRWAFYILFFTLPLSIEFALPGGFGTDLPTEPLVLLLLGLFIPYLIYYGKELSARIWTHPLSLLLLLHFGWIGFTAIFSSQPWVSTKFFLAKGWYLAVYFFFVAYLFNPDRDYRNIMRLIIFPTALTAIIILARHAAVGFSFKGVNFVMGPFYRNHVIYASLLVALIPHIWFLKDRFKMWSGNWWLYIGLTILFLIGIQYSYTRAAMLSVGIAIGGYFMIRWKLTKWACILAIPIVIGGVYYLTFENKYLDLAPKFERTISHRNFENLVAATYKLEDISTMERVYRWVAGGFMLTEKPWIGHGPGSFVFEYRPFTVTSFITYVSDNEEGSGIHSYYLMTAVEQGLIGLVILLAFLFAGLFLAEHHYHSSRTHARKQMIMAIALSLLVIDSIMLINDMLETDKIGGLFFIQLALLVRMGKEESESESESGSER